ncbi:MAG: argininosuccinate lyase [Pirellulales bacterium]|nr:argininosuccinate lyase [Pirellulales bacterium]
MAEKPWGGVFERPTDRRVEEFTESVSFDRRLYRQDIDCSLAHARMLEKVGLIEPQECRQIEQALQEIRLEIEQGRFPFRAALEDIHMHVERALIDRIGDAGRKLHAARSRNDQVAADLRLWVREAIDRLDNNLSALQRAFLLRCEKDSGVILPGYTHLRRAQPVLAAHCWLAYCEQLDRDRSRLVDCRRRTNVSPLGAGALAGTSLPIDRHDAAARLGFDGPSANSLDAVADRDFALEFAFAMALIAEHLGGWAEQWIIWSTDEFGFLKLPEEFCTGSSIMPQKINPDVLELIRGKTARAIGNLQTLLVLVKGLPLGYNRDLQDDKPPLMDSFDAVRASLETAAPLVEAVELDRPAIAARLDRGHLDATTLMEQLISRGLPQRTAHELVGRLVRKAMDRGVRLADLSPDEFREVHPKIDESVYDVLGPINAVAAMTSYGSTGPEQVEEQIRRWKELLSE